ncbi:MAG: hypothetical protein HKN82_02075 [Akkermansiaceae bacterium]|nr:hypothetical protein [Akkermansiaceae bacterium]
MTTWIERRDNLRRDKKGRHEKPHKPVVLLTVLDLVERGELTGNRIAFTPELVDRYKEIFEVVAGESDRPNIHLPLYHLSGDGFWHHVP